MSNEREREARPIDWANEIPLTDRAAERVQTTKEAWWAGYRAGKGLPPDTPRQEALAAPVGAQQVGYLNTMTRKFIGLAELAATQRNQSLIDEGVIVKCYTVPPAQGEQP